MPSPMTAQYPRPKSPDEFEDICLDYVKLFWKDPHANRNGRQGQRQHGVDIHGHPAYLQNGESRPDAGAQCKNVRELTFGIIESEVDKAKSFRPKLTEYLVLTTVSRDANLQEQVRNNEWPFDVKIKWWEDICNVIAKEENLLHNHFPSFVPEQRPMTHDRVIRLLESATCTDFQTNASRQQLVYKHDVDLRIKILQTRESFNEPWVTKYPDPSAYRSTVGIYYRNSLVHEEGFVEVDGSRHFVPLPRLTDMSISRFQYHVAKLVNEGLGLPQFDFLVCSNYAKIKVRDE